MPGEIVGQCKVKVISPVAIGFALNRTHLEHRYIHAGGFDGDLGAVHGLSEEVVGMNASRDVIARAVAAFRLVVLAREIYRNLEFREDVFLDVQCDFGGVRRRIAIPHQSAQMVRAQVYFIGQSEFRRTNSKFVRRGDSLENLVATRVFHFESQLAVGGRGVIGAIQRQGPRVNRLTRLVDGLFGGKKNRYLVFQPYRLSEFRGTDWRVHRVAQLITAHQSSWKPELRLGSPPWIELAGEKHPRLLIGHQQIDLYRTPAGNDLVLRIRDDQTNRCLATGQIRLLPQDVKHRRTENLRNRFHALDGRALSLAVFEAVAHAMPYQFINGK